MMGEIGEKLMAKRGRKPKPMLNTVFGNWLVIELVGTIPHYRYLCQCTCGRDAVVRGDHLRAGRSKMCRSCAAIERTKAMLASPNHAKFQAWYAKYREYKRKRQ
jgi:hypothetical protein